MVLPFPRFIPVRTFAFRADYGFRLFLGQPFNKLTETNIEPLQSVVIFLLGSIIGFVGQKVLEKY